MKRKSVTALSILLFGLIMILGACSPNGIPNSTDWPVGDFAMINQDKKTVASDDLKDTVWVANFIFTNCVTVCMPMTANMAKLQAKLNEQGLNDVRLVSFSVDPAEDNPEVLRSYGDKYNADYSNWDFLTGYEQSYIEQFAKEKFKTMVTKPDGENQVMHGTSFYLVNQDGVIIQSYSGVDDFPLDEIVRHIKILKQ
ncbi:MAG: SCO family protein [Bacillus sp. (in: firmicutes)]